VPQKARDDLDIRLVNHMDEVLEIALRPAAAKKRSTKSAKDARGRKEEKEGEK